MYVLLKTIEAAVFVHVLSRPRGCNIGARLFLTLKATTFVSF